jgi:hypothetical protein
MLSSKPTLPIDCLLSILVIPACISKKIHDKLYSVRVGKSYRALGLLVDTDLIIWIWIGSHAEYDKFIKQLVGRL